MTTVEFQVALATAERYEQPVVAPESLRPWITEIGHVPTLYDLPPAFTYIPRAVTTIVLRTEPFGRSAAFVVGPHTRAAYTATGQPAGCTRLRLAPGATQSLLGLAAADLTDRALPLAEVPGIAAEFANRLTESTLAEALDFLESELPQRLPDDPTQRAHRGLLNAAVEVMTRDPGSVREVAEMLAVSERQLRKLFTDGIGVSPKHFARIARLRRVLAAAGNTPWADMALESGDRSQVQFPHTSLAQLAAANGFYDQSHMTADFRSLMGVTVDRFFKGRLPAPAACGPPASTTG